MEDFNPSVRLVLWFNLSTPPDGPDVGEIEATAAKLDRSLPNFVAFSTVWLVQNILEEAERGAEGYTTLDAIVDTADRIADETEVGAYRMATILSPDAPSLRDVDEAARAAGVDRNTFISACTVANAEFQAHLIENAPDATPSAEGDEELEQLDDDFVEGAPETLEHTEETADHVAEDGMEDRVTSTT